MGIERLSRFFRASIEQSKSQSFSSVNTTAFEEESCPSVKLAEGVDATLMSCSFKLDNFEGNASLLLLIHNIVVELTFFTLKTFLICRF
jgi:hypothetical protein